MSEFKNKSITSKGMELLARALSGEQLEFTRIEMGSGKFEGDIGSAESLVNTKQNLTINKITRKGSQVTLSTALRIEDITTSFEWTEIGVYARGKDNVEVLYMYGYTTNSSYISMDSLNEKLINVTVLVTNATQVTAVIDNSLVYLTAEALEEHTKDMSTHQDIRDSIDELRSSLDSIDISWEGIKDKPTAFEPVEHKHSWGNITYKPTAFPPENHTHDDRYLTTEEINNTLSSVGKCRTKIYTSAIAANAPSGVVLDLISPRGGYVDIRGLSTSAGYAQIEVDGKIIISRNSWLSDYMKVNVSGGGSVSTTLILHYTQSVRIEHFAQPGNYSGNVVFQFVINEYV